MPSEQTSVAVPSDTKDLPPKAQTVLTYLDGEIEEETYLKSRFIAQDLDLSAKEIGAMMSRLEDCSVGLVVEKWGYTNGTTWRVRPKKNSD